MLSLNTATYDMLAETPKKKLTKNPFLGFSLSRNGHGPTYRRLAAWTQASLPEKFRLRLL